MTNPYTEIKNAFQFLGCAVRNNDRLDRCKIPSHLQGVRAESVLRDYVFCLTLVSMVAQLEYDIEKLQDIPLLKQTDKLKPRLKVLKDHFNIKDEVFWPVDLIRDARNSFVHDGETV